MSNQSYLSLPQFDHQLKRDLRHYSFLQLQSKQLAPQLWRDSADVEPLPRLGLTLSRLFSSLVYQKYPIHSIIVGSKPSDARHSPHFQTLRCSGAVRMR